MNVRDRIPLPIREYIADLEAKGANTGYRLLEHFPSEVNALLNDPRMDEVWGCLDKAEFTDEEKTHFFWNAIISNQDFGAVRHRTKECPDRLKEIAEAANQLAELLQNVERYGCLDADFLRIQGLLRYTPGGAALLDSWTGDNYIPYRPEPDHLNVRVSELLRTLATAAETQPEIEQLTGVRAALSSRKADTKWEYIRCLMANLLDLADVAPSFKLAEAIAVTTAVVLKLDEAPDPHNVAKSIRALADSAAERARIHQS